MGFTKIISTVRGAALAVTIAGGSFVPVLPVSADAPVDSAHIAAQRVAGANHVTVVTGSASPKYSVMKLKGPDRLVLDIEDITFTRKQATLFAKTLPRDLEFVQAVRVGNHPGKTRVVVDLKNSSDLSHEATVNGGAITLIIAPQGKAREDTTGTAKKTAATSSMTLPSAMVQRVSKEIQETNPLEHRLESSSQALKRTERREDLRLSLDEEVIVSGSSSDQDSGSKVNLTGVSNAVMPNPRVPKLPPVGVAQVKNGTDVDPVARARLSPPVLSTESQGERKVGDGKTAATPQQKQLIVNDVKSPPKVVKARDILDSLARNQKPVSTGTLDAPTQKGPDSGIIPTESGISEVALKVGKDTRESLADEKAKTGHEESKDIRQELVEKGEQPHPAHKKDTTTSVTAAVKDPKTTLVSMKLEGHGKQSPSVVLALHGDAGYSMDRTAPSEYVLTLKDTAATEVVLRQTLFASQESSGIRSVRAVTEGNSTLVRIFAQPTSYLTAKRVGDVVRVEETQDLAQIARDIRAQIAPAAAKEADEGKGRPEGKDSKRNKTPPKALGEKPSAPSVSEDGAEQRDGELAAIKGTAQSYTGRLISLDLQDADIDSALRIIAEVSNLNIVAGDGVAGKVTLKLVDVPWDQALEVILKSHGLDKVLEGNVLRVAPVDKLRTERESFKQARVAEEELEPLSVKYIRVSYAKASEIKGLVETVLSERGSVAFDERSNQLVVKDTRKGLRNVSELIKKVDLRTPQILLETQIIEANRNLSRQLGAELGFQYIQSPATGNGTGLNFPAAIAVGGSADPTNANSITGSAFPIASSASLGSAVTMLFDSADGTKSLALRLSQLEQEGQVRIISKPAVATTNNKAAEIKSVEKYRVKLPNGGLSIASGSGASSSGSGDVATQTIEAGIILNVTPQASPDYYILLDIKAKSSSFGAKSVDGIPNEIERSASSSVLVSSGQTFALGGIYKINEQDRVSGVPFFKDIPVIGTLFRSTTTEQSDEELLFFITPRIVEGSFEDATARVVS